MRLYDFSWSIYFRSFICYTSFALWITSHVTLLARLHSFEKMSVQITFSFSMIWELRWFIEILQYLFSIFLRLNMRSLITRTHLAAYSAWIIRWPHLMLIFILNRFERSARSDYLGRLGIIKLNWRLFLHIILMWVVIISR